MLNFPPAVRIWLVAAPVDLRRSFDRLAAEVRDHLHNDPVSGHMFVFKNERDDRVKLLYWDEDGYVIVYKRLKEGVLPWPAVAAGQTGVPVRAAELAMLLDGIDWSKARRGQRDRRSATAAAPA
jgi:transposase